MRATARRVWPAAAFAALVGLLLLVTWPGTAAGTRARDSSGLVDQGRALFQTGCSTCHGTNGGGTHQGPLLIGVGAAAADFQLSTGRMPLDQPQSVSIRKPRRYDHQQIDALVAYVASLGKGPAIPKVDTKQADIAHGQVLFSDNCAGCHSATGAGGALGPGIAAPSLHRATDTQAAEAMRTGPGPMPKFGPDTLSTRQVNDIVKYVQYLKHPEDRGGLGLGRVGPIPEGFVAWIIGLGLLLLVCRWIGARE